jgi:hypothetical protein
VNIELVAESNLITKILLLLPVPTAHHRLFLHVELVDNTPRLLKLSKRLVLQIIEAKSFGPANLNPSSCRCPLLRSRNADNYNKQAISILLRAERFSILRIQNADEIRDNGENLLSMLVGMHWT